MSDVAKINSKKRPNQIALMSAITKQIYDMAESGITPIEILGALEMAKLEIYQDQILFPILEGGE